MAANGQASLLAGLLCAVIVVIFDDSPQRLIVSLEENDCKPLLPRLRAELPP